MAHYMWEGARDTPHTETLRGRDKKQTKHPDKPGPQTPNKTNNNDRGWHWEGNLHADHERDRLSRSILRVVDVSYPCGTHDESHIPLPSPSTNRL